MKQVTAYFTIFGYKIEHDGIEVYQAGNSRLESSIVLVSDDPFSRPADMAGLREIKKWATQTAQQDAKKHNCAYSVVRDKDSEKDIKAMLHLI